MRLSVLVAAYNSERTIGECLTSIQDSVMTDFECLIADDGSTDKTAAIIDDFAAKDSRFKVFHKKNEGVGATREFLLQKADGDYITFVDADDVIHPMYYEYAFNFFTDDIDIVNINYLRFGSDINKSYIKGSIPEGVYTSYADMVKYHILVFLWDKIFKKEVIKDVHFRRVKFDEDQMFLHELYALHRPKIRVISDLLYYKRIFDNSVQLSRAPRNKEDLKAVWIAYMGVREVIRREKLDDHYIQWFVDKFGGAVI